MANVHGSKAKLYLDDVFGACQDASGDVTSITFTRSKNNPESTTLGNGYVQRIDGLRDVTMDVTCVFNTGDPAIIEVLDGLYAGSVISRAQYLPGGSQSGSPIYTASMRLNNYVNNSPVDGITTVNFSLAIAAGSMTAACIA